MSRISGVRARLAFVSFVPGAEEDVCDLHAALSSLSHFIPVVLEESRLEPLLLHCKANLINYVCAQQRRWTDAGSLFAQWTEPRVPGALPHQSHKDIAA
jgi:hypothetical protein